MLLYWAARNGCVEIVKLLLEKRADRAAVVINGEMLLYWAAENRHVEVVKLLLEKGADVAATD
jgi:ankyrin repeat protein